MKKSTTLRPYRPVDAGTASRRLLLVATRHRQPSTASRGGGAPGHIRITQADGARVDLRNPRVETDSLTAATGGGLLWGGDPISIALSDVSTVEVLRFSSVHMLVATVAVGLGVFAAAWVLVGVGSSANVWA